jgi:hypothetical protein
MIESIPHRARRALAMLVLAAAVAGCAAEPKPNEPPRIAGQRVGGEPIAIDFERRFTLHTQLGNEKIDFTGCKIVGFVDAEAAAQAAAAKSWNPSGSIRFFSHSGGWIVIEQHDGRRAYVPANAVIYFEDAAP